MLQAVAPLPRRPHPVRQHGTQHIHLHAGQRLTIVNQAEDPVAGQFHITAKICSSVVCDARAIVRTMHGRAASIQKHVDAAFNQSSNSGQPSKAAEPSADSQVPLSEERLLSPVSRGEQSRLRDSTRDLFQHALDGYMRHAFPADELRPKSCTPTEFEPTGGGRLREYSDAAKATVIDDTAFIEASVRGRRKAVRFIAGIAHLVLPEWRKSVAASPALRVNPHIRRALQRVADEMTALRRQHGLKTEVQGEQRGAHGALDEEAAKLQLSDQELETLDSRVGAQLMLLMGLLPIEDKPSDGSHSDGSTDKTKTAPSTSHSAHESDDRRASDAQGHRTRRRWSTLGLDAETIRALTSMPNISMWEHKPVGKAVYDQGMLTLLDSLDTIAVMGNASAFRDAVRHAPHPS